MAAAFESEAGCEEEVLSVLQTLLEERLDFFGSSSKAVVWAHNAHVGDAYATEMGRRGEFNIGALCNKEFKEEALSIGFGTYRGEVAAADHWGGTRICFTGSERRVSM